MKKTKITDPYAEREAQKYEHPIPSRECIMQLLEQAGVPYTQKQLLEALGIDEPERKRALSFRLKAMLRAGQLLLNRRGQYGLVEKMDLIRGRVIAHRDGHGFLERDDGGDKMFLSAREMRRVFHHDVVLACLIDLDRQGRPMAGIVEILERHTRQIVGRLNIDNDIAFLQPDSKQHNKDLLIPANALNGAEDGDIVVAEILNQEGDTRRLMGNVIEVLGQHMAPGMEIEVARRAHELPFEWPLDVLAEAKQIPSTVTAADKTECQDLTSLDFVTIDGEDARDFDDAVYCELGKQGSYRLYVAIANVSHYVAVDSALDREAYQRGTSVYFPGEVIPMLPESLSNGICSLNPECERLALVCELSVSSAGQVKRSRFYEAVIYSKARLTYTEVGKFIEQLDADKQDALSDKLNKVSQPLKNLYQLFKTLSVARQRRGAIEFATKEPKFHFDDKRKIEKITVLQRNKAHRLIEECMLLANVAAAKFVARHKLPFLYRVHDKPDSEKLNALREFLSEFGLKLGGGKQPTPMDYCKLITETKERDDAALLQTVMLRSMSLAVYDTENIGHFGLAYKEYAHFTSPIRRYPDLLLHRAIKHIIKHGEAHDFVYDDKAMLEAAEHCSLTERRAEEASRDVVEWLKCEFMLDKLGQTFPGIITSVTSFGIFVQLVDIYIEGLVHITGLGNDYFHFDAKRHRLVGERSGKRYRLGDKIKVLVSRVDLDDRKIDFELV